MLIKESKIKKIIANILKEQISSTRGVRASYSDIMGGGLDSDSDEEESDDGGIVVGGKKKKSISSWKGKLGKKFKGGINFHKMLDGKNNYRAGIQSNHTNPTVNFFKELKKEYKITKIITLNSEVNRKVSKNAKAAGLSHYFYPSNDNNKKIRIGKGVKTKSYKDTVKNFNEIKDLLDGGNTLIHCTHGADRTGAIVARYYMDKFGWSKGRAISDSKKYKSGSMMRSVKLFIEKGPQK